MNIHVRRRLFVVAAALAAVAVLAMGFFVALEVRSVVAGPDAGPAGPVPNPGHPWTEVQGHGVDPNGVYISTQDDEALELRVNGSRALRLEPKVSWSPNVIGGYSGNTVWAGVMGAAIGGGGSSTYPNRATDDYGTVGGGESNQAGDNAGTTSDKPYATVGGGNQNTASGYRSTVGGGDENSASGGWATVAGGGSNTASGHISTVGGGGINTASGFIATVGGGSENTASGNTSTVGGGDENTASGGWATVPGGWANTADGDFSFAAGRRAKANHDGTFVWADSTDADFASTTADQFLVRASGGVSLNVASGGLRLEPNATSPNLIGGYSGNSVATGVVGAAIGGGGQIGLTNRATDDYATVGGGQNNQAGDNAGATDDRPYATVGGGVGNTASGGKATVGGGRRQHRQQRVRHRRRGGVQ